MQRRVEVLNADRHRRLRLRAHQGYGFARGVGRVDLLFAELRRAAASCPIVFVHEDGAARYQPLALLAHPHGPVAANGVWRVPFLPLVLRIHPFSLAGRAAGEPPLVCVDMASDLLSESDGVELFRSDGRATPALEQALALLDELHRLQDETGEFCRVLAELGLFTPLAGLPGYHQIDAVRLDGLGAAALLLLRHRGWLAAMYAHLASLEQLDHAVEPA